MTKRRMLFISRMLLALGLLFGTFAATMPVAVGQNVAPVCVGGGSY